MDETLNNNSAKFEMSIICQDFKINLRNDLLQNHLKKIGIIEMTYKTRLITNIKREIYRLFKEKIFSFIAPIFLCVFVRACFGFQDETKKLSPAAVFAITLVLLLCTLDYFQSPIFHFNCP